jgi:AcrR family transcriptional regulator
LCVPAGAKTRKQALVDFRRAEILAAALKVFCKKGYTEARMEDVAAQAKIAKGTLYLYFTSKAEIFSAAAHSAMEQLSTLAVERIAGITDFHTRLETLIAVRLDFWMEQRSLYRMLLTVGRAPEHRKQTHAIVNRAVASIQSILEEGVRNGEVAPQTLEPLAQAIVDMMRGAIERRLDGLSKNSSAQDAREISRIAFSALGLPAETPLIS